MLADRPLLSSCDLPPDLRKGAVAPPGGAGEPLFTFPEPGVVLEGLIGSLLDQALVRSSGNKSRTAMLLGIHRDQVRYWVKKYRLERWIRRRPRAAAPTAPAGGEPARARPSSAATRSGC